MTIPPVRVVAATLLGAFLLVASVPAAKAATEDPDLDQQIEADQPIATDARALTAGHVDLGPRYVDGEWRFLIHDDAARADANAESVWRPMEQTVLHALDAAELTVPDDPAYGFLPAAAGESVYVVPQTQNPDVVWIGWNTQDPEVMATIDRGITLSLEGVEGAGEVSVYLQSGTFGEPEALWDSRTTEPQPIWVDVNTHTHANWVFTEPGVYLLQITASADLIDGSVVADTRELRIAVGSDTDPADALEATWSSESPGADAAADEVSQAAPASDESSDLLVTALVSAIAIVAVVIVLIAVAGSVRSQRARRRVLRQAGEPQR